MKTNLLATCLSLFVLVGCSSTTPQADEEVKKQMMGRKPTQEELARANRSAEERVNAAREEAMRNQGR